MKHLLILLLGSLLISPSIAVAATINVIGGLHKPPYIIQSDYGVSGFEVEFIQQVMKQMGHSSKFVLVPFARSMKMLDEPNVDAVMTANINTVTDSAQLSLPYVTYQNVAVSLRKNNFTIQQVSDLETHTMASFQMASKVLGESFTKAAEQSPYYIEISNQQRQIELLMQEKIQVLVMDVHIFKYFNRYANLDVTIHPLFPKSQYSLALKNASLVTKFNQQAKKFSNTKQYFQLVEKYHMAD